MKKLVVILLSVFAFVACSKDDGLQNEEPKIMTSLEGVYGSLWYLHGYGEEYYKDTTDGKTKVREYYTTIDNSEGEESYGFTFWWYYFSENFAGYIRFLPYDGGWTTEEMSYSYIPEQRKFIIGDKTYEIVEFSSSRIELRREYEVLYANSEYDSSIETEVYRRKKDGLMWSECVEWAKKGFLYGVE